MKKIAMVLIGLALASSGCASHRIQFEAAGVPQLNTSSAHYKCWSEMKGNGFFTGMAGLLESEALGYDIYIQCRERLGWVPIPPLHQAAYADDVSEINTLIANGNDVNAKNLSGYTPLHIASLYGNNAAIKALLKIGADINAINTPNGFTPLHIAVDHGKYKAVKILVANGAVNMASKDGLTPLDIATKKGDIKIKELLSKK